MAHRPLPDRKHRIIWVLVGFLIFLFTVDCALWELVGETIVLSVYDKTATAYYKFMTQIAEDQTRDALELTDEVIWAEIYANETSTKKAEIQIISPTPAPPIITDIDFPVVIPANGETINGDLGFYDPDGDINRLTIEVISATEFGSADYDPTGYIIDGNNNRGTTQLYIWCKGVQNVTLRATLYDQAGLKSNSMDFSFTCQ